MTKVDFVQNVDNTNHFFRDRFPDRVAAGKVIGKISPDGIMRNGVDKENVIAVDNGALRIQPLLHPGWGRAGIAYGPYTRQAGLVMAVSILNGHNTSQTGGLDQHPMERLKTWARGSGEKPVTARISNWLKYGDKQRTLRLYRWWWILAWRNWQRSVKVLDENLALGWFPTEVTDDPLAEGNNLIMHATGAENGQLWGRIGTESLTLVDGIQNIPFHYIVVLRDKGAVYFAATIPGARDVPAFPQMRPLAIDPYNEEPILYAGVYQSVLGQIGFRADSRINEVQVTQIKTLSNWYSSAHVADRLQGDGALVNSLAEVGGKWHVYRGGFQRTAAGVCAIEAANLAAIHPQNPVGLVHVMVETSSHVAGNIGLVYRFSDSYNYWCWQIDAHTSKLLLWQDGQMTIIATDPNIKLQPDSDHALQLRDDGQMMHFGFNGRIVFTNNIKDYRLNRFNGIGIQATSNKTFIHSFEAHPRCVPIPPELELEPIWMPPNEKIIITDDFIGSPGDLAGHKTGVGNKTWCKAIGAGVINLTGAGVARVEASKQKPNPGRTAYTIKWDHVSFADLEVEVLPPGKGPGEQERGRAGLIFYQDSSNYLIVNSWLDDSYAGSSISSFYHLNGFEELYDAVWTNVGRRISWGVPYRLRVILDGLNLVAFLNDEAVLFRSLTDVYPELQNFCIRQVGLAVNWEWGDDSGSLFRDFIARHKEPSI